jgi:hypothetical protein
MDLYQRVCHTAQAAPLSYMTAGVVAGVIAIGGPGAAVLQNVHAAPLEFGGDISAKIGSMGTAIHAPINFGPVVAAGTASTRGAY